MRRVKLRRRLTFALPSLSSPFSEDLRAKVDERTRLTFYGYMAGYWACTFGHRTGVYVLMKDAEDVEGRNRHGRLAEEAGVSGKAEERYLVHVSA